MKLLGMFCQISKTLSTRLSFLVGELRFVEFFINSHKFAMILRAGLLEGHSKMIMSF